MKLRGTQPALEKLGGEAASVCQRVEDNAFPPSHAWRKVDRFLGRRCDQHWCPKKSKKKAGHPFKYLICPSKPQGKQEKTKQKRKKC
jgi:hypothetical protein